MSIRGKVAKNYKTRFFYVLYSDKTWIFDQSEHAQGPIYVIKEKSDYNIYYSSASATFSLLNLPLNICHGNIFSSRVNMTFFFSNITISGELGVTLLKMSNDTCTCSNRRFRTLMQDKCLNCKSCGAVNANVQNIKENKPTIVLYSGPRR